MSMARLRRAALTPTLSRREREKIIHRHFAEAGNDGTDLVDGRFGYGGDSQQFLHSVVRA